MYNGETRFLGKIIARCGIYIGEKDEWVICAWYVDENFRNGGVGTRLLKSTLAAMIHDLGEPKAIDYIWNGANKYVYDWMEKNFSPICKCSLAVQKNESADNWDSHIYHLDVKKVMNYFFGNKTEQSEN